MPSQITHLDRLIQQETYGPDSGLYKAVDHLLENNVLTITQAIGLARAVRYVISHSDENDVRLFVGGAYLPDFGELVEITGRAHQAILDEAYLSEPSASFTRIPVTMTDDEVWRHEQLSDISDAREALEDATNEACLFVDNLVRVCLLQRRAQAQLERL